MSQAGAVVAAARSRIGCPYVWGATGPDTFDCSGLVVWAYEQIGMTLPRTSEQQAAAGQPVSRDALQPGDVIIYYPDASHVGLCSGGGNVIHASTYGVPVAEVPLDYAGPFNTARRYLPMSGANMLAGIDCAGRPSGASVIAGGYSFVCRYLSDGGSSLPGKLLLASEVADFQANGVGVVSNWETTGTTALGGYSAGVSDAQQAWAIHTSLGGPAGRPIYFSLDWDEAPDQDTAVFAYFQGIASVIGLQQTGAYGGYWPLSRLLDAGLITYAWQTQAWSGGNQDPRINILQDNNAGYVYVDGVECDLDYALTEDFGQWNYQPSGVFMALTDAQQTQLLDAVLDIQTQLRGPGLAGWPQLGQNAQGADLTVVDAIASVEAQLAAIKAALPQQGSNA
jgi:hypothetical protein